VTLVELHGVEFAYPGRRRGEPPFRLGELTFGIEAGEILGLVGPNSAGKTTLIRLLTKVVAPARGEIRLGGRSLAALSRAEVARRVAVVPQAAREDLPGTVAEAVLLGRYPHGQGRFFERPVDRAVSRDAMAGTGVLHLAGAPVARLSGGERQRVALARALCQEPELLVLDEPTTHLDLRHQSELVAVVRRLQRRAGLTVLIVSHDLNLAAEVADRVLLLHRGRIARLGPPDAVLEESTLSRVYGCPVVVDKHPASRRPAIHVVWPEPEAAGAGKEVDAAAGSRPSE
jgi:iron complex transport system ATP-binding protein